LIENGRHIFPLQGVMKGINCRQHVHLKSDRDDPMDMLWVDPGYHEKYGLLEFHGSHWV
jgi:hypothetical protein